MVAVLLGLIFFPAVALITYSSMMLVAWIMSKIDWYDEFTFIFGSIFLTVVVGMIIFISLGMMGVVW